MNILQNLHFTDNQTADKSDKVYKMRFKTGYLYEFDLYLDKKETVELGETVFLHLS